MKDKPTKWGVKVWVLADSTNGYVKRFQIYTGKGEGTDSSIGLCSRVVLDLMRGLESSGLQFKCSFASSSIGWTNEVFTLFLPFTRLRHQLQYSSPL